MNQDETLRALVEGADADAALATLDRQDPEHRSAVLSAIESLAIDRVLAAVDCPPSKNRFDVFDLNVVAGEEVSPLVLGLFAEKLDGLRRPDEETLREAMEYISVDIPDAGGRDKFYRCWAANKAAMRIDSMLLFLTDGITRMNDNVRRAAPAERARLAVLREKGLPVDVDVALELAEKKYELILK